MSTAKRITVPLSMSEWEQLRRIADDDCRHPRDQARYMLKQALERVEIKAGQLPGDTVTATQ